MTIGQVYVLRILCGISSHQVSECGHQVEAYVLWVYENFQLEEHIFWGKQE
jgi:hypothetical protein